MFRYKYILIIVLLVTAPIYLGATNSFAQNQTTLTIQEGRVLINGKQLDEDQVPRSLDLENLSVFLSFPSSVAPNFELGGRYYTIEDGELNEVRRRDFPNDETTVIFRNTPPSLDESVSDREEYEREEYDSRVTRQSVAYANAQGAASVSAQHNAMMQQYISEVSQRDRALYEQLIEEFELERETKEIALQARSLPPGDDQDEQIENLRQLLGRIFDLKQENRQREIEQLEEQLSILQKRLSEREAMKDKIIDHRIRQLTETPY